MEKVLAHKFDSVKKGQAADLAEFFEQIIKPQFANEDCIRETHNSLMKYIELEDAIFFLRLYGSFVKDKYHLLRRGFVSEYNDKKRMVFCDNTFSMLFTGLKIAGISYDETKLKEYLLQDRLICSFGITTMEKELSYYNRKDAINLNLNSKGWYLAHIKPVGKGYGELTTRLKELFPNPDRSEWDKTKKIRVVDDVLDAQLLEILKAHFIRLIHPFNSFLLPKRRQLAYNGKNLGEEDVLLKYVSDYIKQKFPSEFNEFDKVSLLYKHDESASIKINNIQWSDNPIKQTVKIKEKDKETPKEVTKIYEDDFDGDLSVNLDSWLQSIGKKAFLDILYPELKKNINVTKEEIAQKYEVYAKYEEDSKRSRLASSRSIIKYGIELEALQILSQSNRKNIREKAQVYLKELVN